MKKLLLGLMLTAVAVGGSAFKNVKKSITEGYLIQPISGVFLRATSANSSCWNLHSGLDCAYSVNPDGRINIPSQLYYTNNDVNNFIAEGWLDEVPMHTQGTYIII